MSGKPPKTRHTVLSGGDFHFFREQERLKAERISQALEEKYPSSTVNFAFKLLPLSVGACLLIIGEAGLSNPRGYKRRRPDRVDCEVIEQELMDVEIDQVLEVAEYLVKRWNDAHPNRPSGE
jgi:hypothetical protein